MICVSGLCIKCGSVILDNGRLTNRYNEVLFRLSDASLLPVAICVDCELSESEWPEVMKAINDNFISSGAKPYTAEIMGQFRRVTAFDVAREMQGGRCYRCHEPIGDKWIITNGRMEHESCTKLAEPDRLALLSRISELEGQDTLNELSFLRGRVDFLNKMVEALQAEIEMWKGMVNVQPNDGQGSPVTEPAGGDPIPPTSIEGEPGSSTSPSG